MKKLLLNAIAATVLVAGSANADPADTYEIFLSGASSVKGFIQDIVTNASLPLASRLFVTPATVTTGSGANKDLDRYTFNANPANLALAPYVGTGNIPGTTTPKKKKIVLYKRSKGGSIYGINPLLLDPLPTSQLEYLTIPGPKRTPDLGVSDISPVNFRGDNFPLPAPTGWTPITTASAALLQTVAGPRQVFGIVVNTAFLNKLKTTQATTRPNLTKTQVVNLLKGTYTAGAGLPASPPGGKIHFCSRTQGSGTRAAAGLFFLNYPTSNVHQINASTATMLYHANASQGDMEACLAQWNTTGQWAFGYSGTDNNGNGAKPYEFVRLDGKEPTLTNAASGAYGFRYPLSLQIKKTHVFDTTSAYNTAEKAIVNEIIKEMKNPTTLATLNVAAKHFWGQSGFLP